MPLAIRIVITTGYTDVENVASYSVSQSNVVRSVIWIGIGWWLYSVSKWM